MIQALEGKDVYLSLFAGLEKERTAREPAWLTEIRKAAIASFSELGFPTSRDEAWKFTNVAPLARVPFHQSFGPKPKGLGPERIEEITFKQDNCHQLVFVDGQFAPELSSLMSLPAGVKLGSMAQALKQDEDALRQDLARHVSHEKHTFAALNTAFMTDGAFVSIPQGAMLPEPIHLLFVSSALEKNTMAHPRNLILAGRASQATIIESYVCLESNGIESRGSLGSEPYFTNAVTEVVAAADAILEHTLLECESAHAFHMHSLAFHLGRACNFVSNSIALGGALARNDVNVALAAEGIDCQLNGLYVTSGRQLIDNHTRIEHLKPHSSSREVYKGILDGASSAVFNGKIFVAPDAQKTDAKQSNKNLLLSMEAIVNTNPELEIFADDVKCTHGATIGHVDQDALFYLRSRGLDLATARGLLTYGFASEIIDRIKTAAVREMLNERLFPRLSALETPRVDP